MCGLARSQPSPAAAVLVLDLGGGAAGGGGGASLMPQNSPLLLDAIFLSQTAPMRTRFVPLLSCDLEK